MAMQTIHETIQKPRRRPAYAFIGFAAFVILSMTYAFYPTDDLVLDRSQLHLGTVERGPIVREIRASGRFTPNTVTWLTARVDARVIRKLLKPGAQVSADTLILSLAAPELSQEYKKALLGVKVADARLQAKRAQHKNEYRQQVADVELNRIEKELAIQEADAQKILATRKIITGFEYQAALLRVEQLSTRLSINQQQLAELPHLHRSLLKVEEAEVEQLQLQADLLEDQINSLEVRAGAHGILQSSPLEEGQRITRGTELARIANQDDLKAELNVQEAQAKDLQLGQPVRINTRRSTVNGYVARIDPGVTNGTVLVDIQFESDLPPEARPDLRIDGVVEIERLDDVLLISKPSMWRPVRTADLYRLESNTVAKRTPVTYGINSIASVQLIEGLDEGDVVILSDVSGLDNAAQITLN